MLKKIDKFLIINFLPPFLVSFIIALFVLVMQTLWLYIDEIAGKGVSLLNLLEMISYLSMALIPKALPIGILIASVMVFGGLAERYELSSLKSAGVSLIRILRPAIIFSVFVALFSLFCSEYLIPVANLKFISRLYDIKKKKSSLTLEEGVFNKDFGNMIIHIGSKSDNNIDIADIKIYDQGAGSTPDQLKLITAKRGEMYPTEDGHFFIMRLYEGKQYEDLSKSKSSQYPFTNSSFDEWTKVFDLSEFDLAETENDVFSNHQATMTMGQLSREIDTLNFEMGVQRNKLVYNYSDLIHAPIDSNYLDHAVRVDGQVVKRQDDNNNEVNRKKKAKARNKTKSKSNTAIALTDEMIREEDIFDDKYQHILALYGDQKKKSDILRKAVQRAENYQRRLKNTFSSIENVKDKRVKHIFELHSKLAFALVCIIFIFIGGPMGAIVRKGGFGYPMLISVIFFVVYILMVTSIRRICEGGDFDPVLGAWIPNISTLICGIILTRQALNDSSFGPANPIPWLKTRWNKIIHV